MKQVLEHIFVVLKAESQYPEDDLLGFHQVFMPVYPCMFTFCIGKPTGNLPGKNVKPISVYFPSVPINSLGLFLPFSVFGDASIDEDAVLAKLANLRDDIAQHH